MTKSMLVIIGDQAYILDENDKLQDYAGYEAAFTTKAVATQTSSTQIAEEK